MSQMLLAEGKLADGPDFGVRLQCLLDLCIQRPGLDSNYFRSCLRIMGNGRPAFGAEYTVDGLARGALSGPAFDRAFDGELLLWDDGNERIGGAALALAIIAVIVRHEAELVDVDGVSNGLAETVTSDRHLDGFLEAIEEGLATLKVLAVEDLCRAEEAV